MLQLLDGFLLASFCVAALFFLRFWRDTRDRLFLMFSTAFWVMAVNRVFLAWLRLAGEPSSEHLMKVYLVRLVAFSIILLAIIDKNRKMRDEPARTHEP